MTNTSKPALDLAQFEGHARAVEEFLRDGLDSRLMHTGDALDAIAAIEGHAALLSECRRQRAEVKVLREALENIEANLTGTDNRAERIADSLQRATAALKGDE